MAWLAKYGYEPEGREFESLRAHQFIHSSLPRTPSFLRLHRLKSLRSCLESFSTRLSFSRTSFERKPWFTRSTSAEMEAETSASSLASRWSLAISTVGLFWTCV